MKKLLCAATICMLIFSYCSPSRKTVTHPPQPAPQQNPVTTAPKPAPPAPVVAPVNTLTNEEKATGWKLLFDGATNEGWHSYGSRTIGNAWKVVNGTLFLDANNTMGAQIKSGGDIVSDEEYSNFELQLDWMISQNGNSGVCFYIHEDKDQHPTMWMTGPEMQILDNNGHPDAKIYKHRAGDLYDLMASKTEAAKPPLQWNHCVIRAVNGKLDLYLNDVHVVSTSLWDDNWNNLIAGSKFKDMKGFGSYHIGRIGLQDHGNEVWFRNIKIRRL